MRELPVLNEARCTNCGDCVAICPPQCLAIGPANPWLIRPVTCTSCGACVAICPVEAIALRPLPPA